MSRVRNLYFLTPPPQCLTLRLQKWSLVNLTTRQLVSCCPVRCPPLFGGVATIQSLTPLLDTHVVWGVNLGQNNLTAANMEARAIVEAFTSPAIKDRGIVLDAIEIGNEPDLYPGNGHRPGNYTSTQYVKE